MTDRMTSKTWIEYVDLALTNAVAVEKGEMACVDTATGLLTKGGTSLTLRPIGYFEESGTGDDETLFRVRLFQGFWGHWWDNDAGTAVVATDFGSPCWIKDDRTVSGSGTGRSVAGIVWGVDEIEGVLVAMDTPMSGDVEPEGAAQILASGDYVPTLTDVTNVAASALLDARYVRVGNTVIVFLAVTIDVTAAAATELGVSLPVASALAAVNDLTGIMGSGETVGAVAQVLGDVTNDRAAITFTAVGTGVVTWRGSFSYIVI
jgi:hypothetical protein